MTDVVTTYQLLDVVACKNKFRQTWQSVFKVFTKATANESKRSSTTTTTTTKLIKAWLNGRLLDPPYPVVVQQQRLEPLEQWEPVQLPDLIVGEVNGVELVQSSSQVFKHWDFVACKTEKIRSVVGSLCCHTYYDSGVASAASPARRPAKRGDELLNHL